jgi:hypothetical protein
MLHTMRRILIGMAMLLAAGAATAEERSPVVVELFTSQGCSSCPPADALLAELGTHEGVIPLALHVDYWDYIGWKDRFAAPAFTARQKGYARAQGSNRVYTPQMMIGGAEDVVGSRPMEVMSHVQRHSMTPDPVRLTLRRDGDTLHLRAEALEAGLPPCDIHLVRYRQKARTDVARGENAGRVLVNTHIVESWDLAKSWDGTGTFETTLPVQGDSPLVVLVQEARYGPILAAARLR